MKFVGYLLFVSPLASALPWDGPQPTTYNTANDVVVFSPKPSMAPAALAIDFELKKRATTSSASFSDATCGFWSGDPDKPAYCLYPRICAVDTAAGIWGCCSDVDACTLATSCVPKASVQSACGEACARNPLIRQCTVSDSTICNQNLLVTDPSDPPFTNWYCDSGNTIDTAFADATTNGSHGTSTLGYGYFVTIPSFTDIILSRTTPTTSTSTTSASKSDILAPVSPVTTTSPKSSPSSPVSAPSHSTSSSAPIGAIVGGTVGGVALIMAAAVAFICLRRRRAKVNNVTANLAPFEVVSGNTGSGYGYGAGNAKQSIVEGFYQPAIAEKEAPLPKAYIPPRSPAPQYTSTDSAGNHSYNGLSQQPTSANVYPNLAEMGRGEISAQAKPGSY